MSELFQVEIPAISKHLKHIFETGNLSPESVISKMETTAALELSPDKRPLRSFIPKPRGQTIYGLKNPESPIYCQKALKDG